MDCAVRADPTCNILLSVFAASETIAELALRARAAANEIIRVDLCLP
jgi:hypothetical protein